MTEIYVTKSLSCHGRARFLLRVGDDDSLRRQPHPFTCLGEL